MHSKGLRANFPPFLPPYPPVFRVDADVRVSDTVVVNAFVAKGGNAVREKVKAGADWFAMDFQELIAKL